MRFKKHGVVWVGEFSLSLKIENAGGWMGRFVSHGSGHTSPGSWFPWGRPSRSPDSGHFFLRLIQFCLHTKVEKKAIRKKEKPR